MAKRKPAEPKPSERKTEAAASTFRKLVRQPAPDRTSVPPLSTGSTLLNLACSNRADAALLPGHYYLLVGDSSSGKTHLAKQILAEASIHPAYADYDLILDNPERGDLADTERFFGPRLARRLRPPTDRGPSRTIEDFYDNLDTTIQAGKPFVYVLDSEDALDSAAAVKVATDNRKIRQRKCEGTRGSGDDPKFKASYGDGKAKEHSSSLRRAHGALADTGSMLIVIKQTRDNIGPDAMFNPKTRSGGRALTFYATLELWFSIAGKLKRTVNDIDRKIGSVLRIQVKKNRLSGRDRQVDLRFYPSTGFDDAGSMIDYLLREKHWTGTEGRLAAPEFDFNGSTEKLIARLEEVGRIEELASLVGSVWGKVEEACAVHRRNRYAE